jgi:hypothetical protein
MESSTVLVPVLGFLIMPITLIAYSWLTKTAQPIDAVYRMCRDAALSLFLLRARLNRGG